MPPTVIISGLASFQAMFKSLDVFLLLQLTTINESRGTLLRQHANEMRSQKKEVEVEKG